MSVTSSIRPENPGQNPPPIPSESFNPVETTTRLLEEAFSPVAASLAELNSRLLGFLPLETATSQAVADHVFSAGGKRIRPALFFFACRLFGYKGAHYYPLAAVCEYVHTASLLHDDVVDSATTRRNKPTANTIWGDQASVLVGDLIYARASELMAETGSIEIVKTFARAIRCMSEGELLQLEQVFNATITEETYFKILSYKTGVLIAASVKAAGAIAGASAAEQEALAAFGHDVGMAFQLIDDALDFVGSEEVFGKATLADLPEGKITLPLILLRERATPTELRLLNEVIGKEQISSEDMQQVASLVDQYDTASATIERAQAYTQRAIDSLRVFPATPERAAMERLAERLVLRFS